MIGCKTQRKTDEFLLKEHVRKKTKDFGSDQVRDKPGCTVTEDG